MESLVRLHLGCGKKLWPGYVNIDLDAGDMHHDIRALPYPDDSVDEIVAIHVFEHFYLGESITVLHEWKRVLKPGCSMILEMPCLDKIVHWLCKEPRTDLTLWGLYGDPKTHRSEADLHKWCYSEHHFSEMCKIVGLECRIEPPKFHRIERDMRIVATKPRMIYTE